jgi:hypothetical protein
VRRVHRLSSRDETLVVVDGADTARMVACRAMASYRSYRSYRFTVI